MTRTRRYVPQPLVLLPIESFDYHRSGRYLVDFNGIIQEASYTPAELMFRLASNPRKTIPIKDIAAYSYLGPITET